MGRKVVRSQWQTRRSEKGVPVSTEEHLASGAIGNSEGEVRKRLRQVVTEGRVEEVVDGVGRGVGRHWCGGGGSSPSLSGNVRVLRTELESALGTAIRFDPETERALDHPLSIAAAGD